jgi:hypothetical protein
VQLRTTEKSKKRQMIPGDAEDAAVTVLLSCKSEHELDRLLAVELGPAAVRVGLVHVDSARITIDLTGQRDDSAPVEGADFQAAERFAPPSGEGCVRVFSATDDGN